MKVKVHGTMLSPWVRRLVAFIQEKGAEYEMVNVVPMGEPDPEFLKISPLGKVPVLEVGGRYLPDSLAACAFLENEIPDPRLFPEDSWQLGWMHWLGDYIGTSLFAKVEVPLFIQRFINPVFLQQESDQAAIDQALALMPSHFDYLESQLDDGRPYLIGNDVSLVDLTAGSVFMNFGHAGVQVDAQRWPHLAAYVKRVHARPSFQHIIEIEKAAVGTVSPMFAD